MAFGARGQSLNLHARHIHARWAFALAALAGNAQRHGGGDFIPRQSIRPQLTRERQAQRIGAPASQMLFIACCAIGWAHDIGIKLPAGAIVVAHLNRAQQAAERAGIVRPIQYGRYRRIGGVIWPIAKQAAIIHARRACDAIGVEQGARIKSVLHFFKGSDDAIPKHRAMEFRPHNAITMFTGMAALIRAHQREAFLGDGAHFLNVRAILHVQHRPHMQAANRRMRIPGALGAVLGENLIQPFGVIRQIIQTDRAIFNEGNRFPITLHGHHDIQARFAHFRNRGLKAGIGRAYHQAGMAQIRHHFIQPRQIAEQRAIFLAVEFHNQQTIRFANQHPVNRGAIDRDGTPQIDHGAIHQFHRFRH